MLLALASIDWMNAVIIPLLMTLTVNLALATYGAYVLARWLQFKQLKMQAVIELVNLPKTLFEAEDESAGNLVLVKLLDDVAMIMWAERQKSPADQLKRIAAEDAKFMRETISRYRLEASIREKQIIAGVDWKSVVARFSKERKARVPFILETVHVLRPDYFTLFGVQWLKPDQEQNAESKNVI